MDELQRENEYLRQENERLRQENREQQAVINQLLKRLADAEEKIKKLSEQLSQNSRNSSLPPSRDKKPRPLKPKRKSNRKAGGQEGHQGHTIMDPIVETNISPI